MRDELFLVGLWLVLFAWNLAVQAGRLDRLHRNLDVLQSALDAHLARRAGLLAEASALLDPASSAVAAQAAHDALSCDPGDLDARSTAENAVTAAICDLLNDPADLADLCASPPVRELLASLVAANRKAALSRRFHADAAHACRRVREQRLVRLFQLAGHAQWPATVDFADGLPPALEAAVGG